LGAGRDSYTPEIEPVRVPARLQRGVPIRVAVGVEPTGFEQQFESGVVQVHQAAAERMGKLTTPQPVPVISVFVDATRVMEEGKELDDLKICPVALCDPKAILEDSRPVDHAVITTHRKGIAIEDRSHNRLIVVHDAGLLGLFERSLRLLPLAPLHLPIIPRLHRAPNGFADLLPILPSKR